MTRYSWFVVGVLCYLNLTSAIDQFVMGIAIVPLKSDLWLSDTQLGLLHGLGFGLLYCVAGVPLGRVADLVSRRLMLFWGCSAWTIATAASAFVASFHALFGLRIIVGLGEATLMPAAVSLMAAYVTRGRLGVANGIFMMGASAGKATSFLVGGWILSALIAGGGIVLSGISFRPWQALFLWAALPGLAAAALALSIREPPRAPGTPTLAALTEIWGHVRRHGAGMASMVLLGACSVLIAVVFAAWAPSFFVRRFDLTIGQASLIVGLVVVAVGPLGSVLGGAIVDSMTRRRIASSPVVVIATAILLAIPATALLVLGKSLFVAIIGYALVQMIVMVGGPQSFSAIQVLTPIPHRGLMSASYLAIATLAAYGLGPVSIGLFSDHVFSGASSALGHAILSVVTLFGVIGLSAAFTAYRHFEATAADAQEPTSASDVMARQPANAQG